MYTTDQYPRNSKREPTWIENEDMICTMTDTVSDMRGNGGSSKWSVTVQWKYVAQNKDAGITIDILY